jgi:hypothetical protein
MKSIAIGAIVLANVAAIAALAGCGAKLTTPPKLPSTGQMLYWSFFWTNKASGNEQIESTRLPLRNGSSVTLVNGNATNSLNGSDSMAIDPSGRFWVGAAPMSGTGNSHLYVFTSPPTNTSAPLYTLAIPAANDADHLIFDGSGNLWITSYGNQEIQEYTGPFTGSGSLTPALTLSLTFTPSGLAMDARGDLFVSNLDSSGTQSIAVFGAPILNGASPSYYLDGLSGPGGLIFDSNGNLYASQNESGGTDYIVRYDSNDLNSGSTPSIEDPITGSEAGNAYESNFSFDSAGNLYDADCGSPAHIYVYPLSKQQFSSTLAPSVSFTDATISSTGCVWGILVK